MGLPDLMPGPGTKTFPPGPGGSLPGGDPFVGGGGAGADPTAPGNGMMTPEEMAEAEVETLSVGTAGKGTNWMLWGALALGAMIMFGGKKKGGE